MLEDCLVEMLGVEFQCIDEGFAPNEPVDVVVRPEDIMIVGEDVGMLTGVVESVTFKGVHYEMMIRPAICAGRCIPRRCSRWAAAWAWASFPYNIHIMHKAPEIEEAAE